MGSLLVTGIAMVIAVPLGLAAAAYLAEYAKPRVRQVLKPILEVLAGIPSIVLAFFAIEWIGPNIVENLFVRSGGVQPRGGRHRGRDPRDPARRVGERGRDARGAALAAGGELRHGGAEAHHGDARRVPGRHLRHRRRDHPRRIACDR